MDRHVPRGLAPVDSHAARCRERGDAEHHRSIRLHPVHPDRNLALYVRRIEAAGWQLTDQAFSDDGAHRRCAMRFARTAG
ncbi:MULTISPECIES: hypothetical protein [Kitasatospora]|uniref:hypothetical protein n=1 Tax=Kitasatospora TaxID=2063 RepID=UPI0011EA7114|nr:MULTISPECIES: hypothetical protein [Kitasatospora]